MKTPEELLQQIDTFENEGKRRKAQSTREELLRLLEKKPTANIESLLDTLIKEKTAIDGVDAAIESERYYQNLHDAAERTLGANHALTALGKRKLARVYYIQGRYHEAVAIIEKALPVLEARLGHNSFEVSEALHSRNSWYNIFDPAKSQALIEQEWKEHPICDHLKPVEQYLVSQDIRLRREPNEIRPHVKIYARAYLDLDSIRRKLDLDPCVQNYEEPPGPHSSHLKGFACNIHKHLIAGDYERLPTLPVVE